MSGEHILDEDKLNDQLKSIDEDKVSLGRTKTYLRLALEKNAPKNDIIILEFLHKNLIYNPLMKEVLRDQEIVKRFSSIKLTDEDLVAADQSSILGDQEIVKRFSSIQLTGGDLVAADQSSSPTIDLVKSIFFILYDKYGIEPNYIDNFKSSKNFYLVAHGDHQNTDIVYEQRLHKFQNETEKEDPTNVLKEGFENLRVEINKLLMSSHIFGAGSGMSEAGETVSAVPTPAVVRDGSVEVDRKNLNLSSLTISAKSNKQNETFSLELHDLKENKTLAPPPNRRYQVGQQATAPIEYRFNHSGSYKVMVKGSQGSQIEETIYVYPNSDKTPLCEPKNGFIVAVAHKENIGYYLNRDEATVLVSNEGKTEKQIKLPSEIEKPCGICVIPDGKIVIASKDGLFKLNSELTSVEVSHKWASPSAQVGSVVYCSRTNSIFARTAFKKVETFNLSLKAQSPIAFSNVIQSIAVNSKGELYAAFNNNTIQNIKTGTLFGKKGKERLEFDTIQGISFDPMDNLVVCDSSNSRFQVISPQHEHLFTINLQLKPKCISCSPSGIYFAEEKKLAFF